MDTIFYGNGPIMAQVLTSVVYMLTSASYSLLLQLMMTLAGALMISGWHMSNVRGGGGGHGLIVNIGVVVLLYYGAWAPRTFIVVDDPLNNFQTVVNNVPEGFAVVVFTSNKIANGFATLADQAFTASGFPTEMAYNNGMTPGLMSIATLGELNSQDSYLSQTIISYFNKCLFPALLMGNAGPTVNTIIHSTNLLQDIQTNLSNAWGGNYYSASSPQGTFMPCAPSGGSPNLYTNMVNDIQAAINNAGGSVIQNYVQRMLIMSAGIQQYSQSSVDSNLLQSAGNYLTAAGVSSQQLLAQALLINSFSPALRTFASETGTSADALNAALTQGVLATTTSMTTSYALAQQILPIAFLVVCALIYAILPLVFAMMFVPQLTKKFGLLAFDLLMWLAFWSPIASVINYIVQATASGTFTSFGSSAIAMQNWGYLLQHSHTLMAIAGDMMFFVPILAFALASGSAYAITTVASSITGLSRGMAISSANSMSTLGGAASIQQQGMSEYALGKGAAAENTSPGTYAIQQSDMQASNTAGMIDAFKNFGFNAAREATANQQAKTIGSGLGYSGIKQAEKMGELGTQASVGQLEGMESVANANGQTLEKFAKNKSTLDNALASGNMAAFGNDERLMQQYAAYNMANQLRQQQAGIALMQSAGLLPNNFDSMTPVQQDKAVASAVAQLGGSVSGVNLDQAQAQKILGPQAQAGEYSLSYTGNGILVKAVGKGGADTFYVTPNGVVKEDSQIVNNKIAPSVLGVTESGHRVIADNRNVYKSGSETIGGNKSTIDNSSTAISGNKSVEYINDREIHTGTHYQGPGYSSDIASTGSFRGAIVSPTNSYAYAKGEQNFKVAQDTAGRSAALNTLTEELASTLGLTTNESISHAYKTMTNANVGINLSKSPISKVFGFSAGVNTGVNSETSHQSRLTVNAVKGNIYELLNNSKDPLKTANELYTVYNTMTKAIDKTSQQSALHIPRVGVDSHTLNNTHRW